MKKYYTKHIQTLLDEETLLKLNRLIMMDAFENNTPIKGKSEWLRDLIIDTVEFQTNKQMISEWKPELIKQIKQKKR